ncbi:MAG: AAA family ATPase [Bianqueaceae bacterium]
MLQHIRVQNIALIEDISLDLEDHFNVLTGETGSGKSIILDAVNLALGHRGSRELLREPDKPAQVDLLFCESNPRVLQKLDMLGAPADNEISFRDV